MRVSFFYQAPKGNSKTIYPVALCGTFISENRRPDQVFDLNYLRNENP